jgi:hypothetical protein
VTQYGDALTQLQRAGWRIERQIPGKRDMVVCRQRQGWASITLLSWVASLIAQHTVECREVWVDDEGMLRIDPIKMPK